MQRNLGSNNTDEQYISSYIAELLLEQAVGQVHSVFRSGLNIVMNRTMIFLGSAEKPLSAVGISLQPERMREILGAVEQGNLVTLKNRVFRIYSRAEVIEIDCSELCVKDLSIPRVEKNIDFLDRCLQETDFYDRIGIAKDAKFLRVVEEMFSPDTDDKTASVCIGYLLGRGLGLTPSGDDILTGYGVGLRSFGIESPVMVALRKQLLGQTTDVSIAYLKAMLAGYVNEDWVLLLNATELEDRESVRQALKCISSCGHTSGYDALLGLSIAICFANSSKIKM